MLPKFVQNNNPSPHSVEEQLDYILDLMRASDNVRIRRQFRSYAKPQDEICVGDRMYCAPPPRKLQKVAAELEQASDGFKKHQQRDDYGERI